MASEGEKQHSNAKGFAGLSSMVSDIDAMVASVPKQQQNDASPLTTHAQSKQKEARVRTKKEEIEEAVAAFAADPAHPYFNEVADEIIALIQDGMSLQEAYEKASARCTSQTVGTEVSSPSLSTQQSSQAAHLERQDQLRPTQQTDQAPAQSQGWFILKPVWFVIAVLVIGLIRLVGLTNNNSASRSLYSFDLPTAVVPTSVAPPQAPSRLVEEKPSIGRNNMLSTAQIRYCLAEKIRIDAMASVLNRHINADVDRFNGYVNGYNSRCGEFRYRQGALESAQRDIDLYRSQLQDEGRSKFPRNAAAAPRSNTPTRASQLVDPEPDSTAQAMQQHLEDGFSTGDGAEPLNSEVTSQDASRFK